MLIADSHEFIELYRGDKDLRMGIEMLKIDDELRFVSFAPDKASPNDRERFGKATVREIGLPDLPDRYDLRLLPSRSVRFARKESGGIVSWMPGYPRALRDVRPDVIMENPFSWLTPRSYQTHAFARRHNVPVIYYDPGDDIPVSLKHRVMALWESPVVRDAAAIITYNEAGRRRFMDKYGYPGDRIHVIPKPVDVARCLYRGSIESVRSAYGARPNQLVVSYVGRLTAYKGSATLLAAARSALERPGFENVRFVFVGGALVSSESSNIYRGPNTYVTGMVPNHEVPMHLAAADVVVFPDVTRPGAFPTAVAEAMAAGRVIIVGIGGRTEFLPLRHRENALLVAPSDPEAILAAISEVVRDRELAVRLGSSVGEYARKEMDYPIVASRYLDIMRGLRDG